MKNMILPFTNRSRNGSQRAIDPNFRSVSRSKTSKKRPQKVESVYFAALSITSVGYGDILSTPLERACNAFLLILGQLFVAKARRWRKGSNPRFGLREIDEKSIENR